jgi:hypothetical protein
MSSLIVFLYFIPNFLSPLYTIGGYITIVDLDTVGLYIVTTTTLCFVVVMCTTLTFSQYLSMNILFCSATYGMSTQFFIM